MRPQGPPPIIAIGAGLGIEEVYLVRVRFRFGFRRGLSVLRCLVAWKMDISLIGVGLN